MTLLKKIPETATAFSKEKQRPNETLSSQISLINIPASMREFKAKPIILRIIESDPSKCHSSYIFESNSNNHQCEKPKTSREMKESMLEREREKERCLPPLLVASKRKAWLVVGISLFGVTTSH